VRYVNVSDITPDGPVYVAKDPIPENVQGMFWLVNDGGDALVSFGGPVGSDGRGECNTGRLEKVADNKQCVSISTVREGGWTFQAVAKPGLSGGPYPTPADRFYDGCGMKWKFCLDSDTSPTSFDASPTSTRWGCVNVMAASSTTGEYKGLKNGGHYWRVTTKALGIIPLPNWVLGNFDMFQVMDGAGKKVLPAWDMFAAANKQIVVYDDANGKPPAVATPRAFQFAVV